MAYTKDDLDGDELYDDPDDYTGSVTTYCGDCGKECRAVKVDQGIGAYEYWGFKGFHHDWQWVSDCCEAELLDEVPGLPDEDDG